MRILSEELREAIIISVELLVFSLLLVIIFFFGEYAHNAFVVKQIQDSTITDIVEYRNIYQFSMGKEVNKSELETFAGPAPYYGLGADKAQELSNIVTGDDIVRFIGLYPKEYPVYIYKDKITDRLELTKDTNIDNWSMTYVSDWLGEDINKEFFCLFVYDEISYVYDSVIFKMV